MKKSHSDRRLVTGDDDGFLVFWDMKVAGIEKTIL